MNKKINIYFRLNDNNVYINDNSVYTRNNGYFPPLMIYMSYSTGFY